MSVEESGPTLVASAAEPTVEGAPASAGAADVAPDIAPDIAAPAAPDAGTTAEAGLAAGLEETRRPSVVVRLRRVWRVLAAVLIVLGVGAGWVLIDALSAPGSDSGAAKLAEWGRDHGLGSTITWLEALGYEHDQPVVGGSPVGGIPMPAGAVADPPNGAGAPETGQAPPGPSIPPLAGGRPLPGEGQWHAVVVSGGRPAVAVASVRPDGQHTSFVAGVMRIDPALVRGVLHPGTRDPGGSWREPTRLAGADLEDVAAAFNGGFRLNDPSHNGYYSEGRTVRPLVGGKASLVLYGDGHADVGAWGREVRMTPEVASVRQNLLPLVDDARLNPTCATGGPREWGSTVGQAAFIHRSGFGVTAGGMEIYVGGPSLSVCTLGRILLAAGVVRGMELDINPGWVSPAYFHDHPGHPPSGFRLFPAEQVAPQHYLLASSRDWYAWSLRSGTPRGDPPTAGSPPPPAGLAGANRPTGGHRSTAGRRHARK